jgi:hypothetical protein
MAAALPWTGRAAPVLAVALGAFGFAWVAGYMHMLFVAVGLLYPASLAAGALLAPLVLYPLLPERDG